MGRDPGKTNKGIRTNGAKDKPIKTLLNSTSRKTAEAVTARHSPAGKAVGLIITRKIGATTARTPKAVGLIRKILGQAQAGKIGRSECGKYCSGSFSRAISTHFYRVAA